METTHPKSRCEFFNTISFQNRDVYYIDKTSKQEINKDFVDHFLRLVMMKFLERLDNRIAIANESGNRMDESTDSIRSAEQYRFEFFSKALPQIIGVFGTSPKNFLEEATPGSELKPLFNNRTLVYIIRDNGEQVNFVGFLTDIINNYIASYTFVDTDCNIKLNKANELQSRMKLQLDQMEQNTLALDNQNKQLDQTIAELQSKEAEQQENG